MTGTKKSTRLDNQRCLALVPAAADQEIDVIALDRKPRAGERTGRFVTAVEAVRKPVPLEATHLHLPRQRAARRTGPERLAGHRPAATLIAFPLEVGNQNVGVRRRGGDGSCQANGQRG